jgi:glycyl-tRNA synthetase beta chain
MSRAVYHHYQPATVDDVIPPTVEGAVVAVADKLDSIVELIRVGELPTGSRDPFALRRAANGMLRILIECQWPVSLRDLFELSRQHAGFFEFLDDRLEHYLRDRGATINEVQAVRRLKISVDDYRAWPLHDFMARLRAIRTVRSRTDFERLVDLTKRVDNILVQARERVLAALEQGVSADGYDEPQDAAVQLWRLVEARSEVMGGLETEHRYEAVVDMLAEFVKPVEQFFVDVLVIDPDNPSAMVSRLELMQRLRTLLTRCFDIRELAGQAGGRAS